MKRNQKLSTQVKNRVKQKSESKTYEGNIETMISTGSTLLDLAISGGRKRGGGIPGGILIEIFGPSGSGKTVLLCEIGGNIQRQGGEVLFNDPEARLNKQFAKIFDLNIKDDQYETPNTVPEVFSKIRKYEFKNIKKVNGICADSLAALSTDLEMDNEEGDKMGMRRGKEFSEELRKTCRILTKNNLVLVCSNQVRQNLDAGPYGQKYKSPGGEAIGFYSTVRLRTFNPKKIKKEIKIAGKSVERVTGIETEIEVFKNSAWKPYRKASITILFDYGIDDIRENLKYIKKYKKLNTYEVNGESMGRGLEDAIEKVEELDLEKILKKEVIELWENIESKFVIERKTKKR